MYLYKDKRRYNTLIHFLPRCWWVESCFVKMSPFVTDGSNHLWNTGHICMFVNRGGGGCNAIMWSRWEQFEWGGERTALVHIWSCKSQQFIGRWDSFSVFLPNQQIYEAFVFLQYSFKNFRPQAVGDTRPGLIRMWRARLSRGIHMDSTEMSV